MTARISIIGSCVSRDVLSVLAGVEVGEYVARTSIISIASEKDRTTCGLNISYIENVRPWHKRVVRADIEKTHNKQFEKMRNDWVVIDLIEERSRVIEVANDRHITFSQILSHSSNFRQLCPKPVVPISSEAGQRLWNERVPVFAKMLLNYVDQSRVIIHRALYAPGHPSSESSNVILNKMYDGLARVFPYATVIQANHGNVAMNQWHKWGVAPYHYVDAYYADTARRISQIIGVPFAPTGASFTKLENAVAHNPNQS